MPTTSTACGGTCWATSGSPSPRSDQGRVRMDAPSVEQLPPVELRRRLDRGDLLIILDVREDGERDFCAIPPPASAADLHIPMGQVPSRVEEIREAASSAPLIIYCHHGQRS